MARWRMAVAPGFALLALSLAGLAWIILLGWEASPHSRYLHHGDWSAIGLGAAFCTAVPAVLGSFRPFSMPQVGCLCQRR